MLNKSHLSKPADDTSAVHDNVAGEIRAITEKTTPVNADVFLIEDSVASWIKKKLSWTNIKATLLSYFDTVYAKKGANADITSMTVLTQITRATGGAFDIAIGGASGDDFTVDTNKLVVEGDSGNVGVNTPTPGAKLEVYNGNVYITSMTGDPELRFRTKGGLNPVTKFSLGVDESDGNKFKIGRGTIMDNTRLTIDSSGKIGIGLTNPAEEFHLRGTNYISVKVESTDTNSEASLLLKNDAREWKFQVNAYDNFVIRDITGGTDPFTIDDGAPTTSMRIRATGHIGMGGNPAASAKLDLQSTTGALLLPRMTTTQRDALTAVNGMLIYNTTLNKFQGYENGAWTSLI